MFPLLSFLIVTVFLIDLSDMSSAPFVILEPMMRANPLLLALEHNVPMVPNKEFNHRSYVDSAVITPVLFLFMTTGRVYKATWALCTFP